MKDFEIDFSPQISPELPASDERFSIFDEIESRNRQYVKLCSRFLPVTDKDSVWRYCPESGADRVEQGWKLHISATILTATEVFETVAPFLQSLKVRFKAPASLFDLKNLNTGIIHGYSQIGKFIVVYPQSDGEAVFLAERLHQLTARFSAPPVPFDLRYKPGSCVYYRYGSFKKHKIENEDGSETFVIRDPAGNFVPDLREVPGSKPAWLTNPFPQYPKPEKQASPLDHTFKIFRALSQRGKGGVYQALDLSVTPRRLCIVKEGRRRGETNWDGRDGFTHIRHEEKMLKALSSAGVEAPQIYASFETKNSFYLVLESIEGQSLEEMLLERRRRLSISQVIRFSLKIAQIVARIHSAGLIWRDLKPANLFITENETIRPLDFEGACPIKEPDALFWGTRAFFPGKTNEISAEYSKPATDLFALGVVFYFLIEGKLPEISERETNSKIKRRNIPPPLRRIVSELLELNPELRPTADIVCRSLRAMLSPRA
jgi:hypothetical protein